jgi:hypothetical protein
MPVFIVKFCGRIANPGVLVVPEAANVINLLHTSLNDVAGTQAVHSYMSYLSWKSRA